jgi:hypothetical protein
LAEPWIRVHANLAGRAVVWRAVDALGVTKHEAMGLLQEFWGSVSQHAKNGSVASLSNGQIEAWAGWTGERGQFARFVREKHTDSDGRVNDWDEYAGKLEVRREQDRQRKEVRRKSRGNPTEVHVDSSPNETRRNETTVVVDEETQPDGAVIPEPALTAIYLAIWANGAIAEKWAEQPLALTHSSAIEMAEDLREAGVEWQVAQASIYDQCRESKLPRPPKSINYFRPGILARWESEQSRRMAVNAQPPPRSNGGHRPGMTERNFNTVMDAIKDMK